MIISLFLLGMLVLFLGFFRVGFSVWLTALLAALGIILLSGLVNGGSLVLLLVLVVVPLIVFGIIPVRRSLISRPLLSLFRKTVPELSATEKEAVDSGDVWWDAELFSGNPSAQKLFSTPESKLSPEERAFIDGPVEALCEQLDDWEITENLHDLPAAVWDMIKSQGFFGMIIPKAYGGREFSAAAHSAVVMKLATRSITAAVTVMVPNSLGPGELLLRYGTAEQKNYYLPRLASGAEIPCFALTAPEAGSDAGSMTDYGVICHERDGDADSVLGIRLNWDKRYITLGPVATLLGIAFKLYDPDHLIGDTAELGISLALVPTGSPGVDIGDRHNPLGIPFQNGPTQGKDVFVPLDSLIGGVEFAGKGWRMLTECLAQGRGISLPALATGAAKHISGVTGAYAALRHQFHQPIGQFEGVQEALGRIGGWSYLCEASRQFTLSALDQGLNPSVATAILKYHLTELMRRIVNDAMDIHGGKGIMLGPRNYLARIYQSIPISITVEGANILTRSMMIYGQGAMRCHPYVLGELEASSKSGKGALAEFDLLVSHHVALLFSNFCRSLVFGLFTPSVCEWAGRNLSQRYFQQLSRLAAGLSMTSDISMMLLGGSLKRREALSARLGDVLSFLYLSSAVIKYYADHGEPQEEKAFFCWAADYCLYEAQQAFVEFFSNFPRPSIGRLLKFIIFPRGAVLSAPADVTTQSVAQALMQPGEARKRLIDGIYQPENKNDPVNLVERAFQTAAQAEDILERARQTLNRRHIEVNDEVLADLVADGVITEAQASLLAELERLRQQVIAVDAFSVEKN